MAPQRATCNVALRNALPQRKARNVGNARDILRKRAPQRSNVRCRNVGQVNWHFAASTLRFLRDIRIGRPQRRFRFWPRYRNVRYRNGNVHRGRNVRHGATKLGIETCTASISDPRRL